MKAAQKRIIVSVTNDLVSDNRVHKVCTTLHNMGFRVLLVGRELPWSQPVSRDYDTKRLRLRFKKGVCFYAGYNIRLFLFLLFSKADVLLSNDLDTLTANFLAGKLKNTPVVYDSHEYFTEVPELIGRPKVQRIWEWLEKRMVPRVKKAYTVCGSIAKIYTEKYGIPFRVVRNIPHAGGDNHLSAPGEDGAEKTILYQGAVNMARGLEQAIRAMHFVDGARLVIAGDGDIKNQLEHLVETENLGAKVEFKGRLPIDQLAGLTPTAHLGLSIEEDKGLNYRYALPNKLFDYIRAGVPVLVTDLPEMRAIVDRYKIGEITGSLEPERLAEKINLCLNDTSKRKTWEKNLEVAAAELTWEREEKIIREIFAEFLEF